MTVILVVVEGSGKREELLGCDRYSIILERERFLQSGADAAYAVTMGFTGMGLTERLSNGGSVDPTRTEQAMGNRILLSPGDS